MREVLLGEVTLGLDRIEVPQHRVEVFPQRTRKVGREALANDDPQHRDVLRAGRHGVGRHLPAVGAQPRRDIELGVAEVTGQLEGHHGDLRSVGDDLEVLGSLQLLGQQLRGVRQRPHHLGVTAAAQAQEVVVLTDHLVSRPGEVQGERRHVPAEVVHPEDQILRQKVGVAPHHETDTWIGQSVLVAADVDRRHPRETEVPLEVGMQEWHDESSAGPVDMHRDVQAPVLGHGVQRGADVGDRLQFTGVGGAQDGHHADGVLVATDCLSEGINLQEWFTAVLHYDLPWNPNRIEQREGRVDRFGQESPTVKTLLLWGEDNPVDRIVLKILIRKVRDIQKATGVSISLGDDKTSIMDAVIQDVLLETQTRAEDGRQMMLFADELFTNELEAARKKAENLRSIFAHESIDPDLINQSLDEIDEAIGDPQAVESFVLSAVIHLGGSVVRDKHGYLLTLTNLPPHLKTHFPFSPVKPVKVSFESPTPAGYRYIGRNHLFVEQLCQFLLSLAFEPRPPYKRIARASVIQTESVAMKTTLIQFRVRNVIREVSGKREVISEEMCLWGYRGSGADAQVLSTEEARQLLEHSLSKANIPLEMQQSVFREEERIFASKTQLFKDEAEKRAESLVEAHGRFKELVGGKRYEAVYPVLPPDIMGVYVLLPVPETLF